MVYAGQVMYGRVKGVLPIQTPPYREPASDADCHCSFISPSVDDPAHLQAIKSQVAPILNYHLALQVTAADVYSPHRVEAKSSIFIFEHILTTHGSIFENCSQGKKQN